MKNSAWLLIVFLLTMVSSPYLFAQSKTGLQVIESVYNRPNGSDMSADLTMTLINARGDQRVRKIKQFSKEFGKDEKKIMFFISPADVKNTSFMNWSYGDAGKDDDQWIYLPALKKTKRISSDSKSDYFMGSDFTYDDLGDRQPSEDSHKIIKEEKINGEACYVIESKSKETGYMYSKTISWVIKEKWIEVKKEFYDDEGKLLKILTAEDYKTINTFHIVTKTTVKNVQTGHATEMKLENIVIDGGISNDKFTERTMTKGI